MSERYRMAIHAFVLMGNHWRVVLQRPEANWVAAMQWLHMIRAAWFNQA